MRNHESFTQYGGDWDYSTIIDDYKESVTYDANGNIQAYFRNGSSNQSLDMDDLTYHYIDPQCHNRLNYVEDSMGDTNYDVDIDQQDDGNYSYDNIGNLMGGRQAGTRGCIGLQVPRAELIQFRNVMGGYLRTHSDIRLNVDVENNPNLEYEINSSGTE